jgi:hypothetical protein
MRAAGWPQIHREEMESGPRSRSRSWRRTRPPLAASISRTVSRGTTATLLKPSANARAHGHRARFRCGTPAAAAAGDRGSCAPTAKQVSSRSSRYTCKSPKAGSWSGRRRREPRRPSAPRARFGPASPRVPPRAPAADEHPASRLELDTLLPSRDTGTTPREAWRDGSAPPFARPGGGPSRRTRLRHNRGRASDPSVGPLGSRPAQRRDRRGLAPCVAGVARAAISVLRVPG